jgi:hypothetical protein
VLLRYNRLKRLLGEEFDDLAQEVVRDAITSSNMLMMDDSGRMVGLKPMQSHEGVCSLFTHAVLAHFLHCRALLVLGRQI